MCCWLAKSSIPQHFALNSSAHVNTAPIVMTNGVFALLHDGHLRYLRHPRREGDLMARGHQGRQLSAPGSPLVSDLHQVGVADAADLPPVVDFEFDTLKCAL